MSFASSLHFTQLDHNRKKQIEFLDDLGSFKLPWVQWYYPILPKNATQKTWAKVNVESKIHYYDHKIIKKLKQFCMFYKSDMNRDQNNF